MTELRIPALTDQHRATFPQWVDEWTAIGRSTEPLNRPDAARAIALAYQAAGLEPPVVFYGISPLGGVLMRHILREHANTPGVVGDVVDGVWDGVWDGVRDGVRAGVGGVWEGVEAGVWAGVVDGVRAGVWAGVMEGVGAGVRDGVRDGVGDDVWEGVWDGVWEGVGAGVGEGVAAGVRAGVRAGVGAGVRDGVADGVGDDVRDGVWAGVWAGVVDGVGEGVWDGVRAGVGGVWEGVWDGVDVWSDLVYGCHEAGWLSYYDWFARHGLADVVAPLDGLLLLARSAGWCWVHRGFAVVTDRPATLHDELVPGQQYRRRLHNPDGPSVTYRDGWELHHWHGQLVPAWVINDSTIDRIRAERNTEIRRCAIERYGWVEYLDGLGVTPVDSTPDPGNPGQRLELFDLPPEAQLYPEPVRLLVMRNASLDRGGVRRVYAETVPADMPDALTAAAWQFGRTPAEYARLERAT